MESDFLPDVPRSRRGWMIGLLVAIWLGIDVATTPLMEQSLDRLELTLGLYVVAVFLGKLPVLLAVAGFAGPTWVRGYWLGMVLWAASLAAFWFGLALTKGMTVTNLTAANFYLAFLALPLSVFVGAVPLLGMRFLFGWNLSFSAARQRAVPLRIVDLFAMTAVLAAALTFVRLLLTLLLAESGQFWMAFGAAAVFLLATGILLVPSLTWMVLAERRRLAGAVAALAVVAPVWIWSLASGGLHEGLATLVCLAVAVVTLAAMRFAGIRVRRLKRGIPTESPHESAIGAADGGMKSLWITMGVAVVLAIVANGIAARIEARRLAAARERIDLQELAASRGGSLRYVDDVAFGLELGPLATNEDFARFRNCRQLNELVLAGEGINDESLAVVGRFTKLDWLALTDTQITDHGLANLHSLTELLHLDVSSSKITGSGLRSLPRSIRRLNLSGTSVSDETLPLISDLTSLVDLDVSSTSVSGKSWQPPRFLEMLRANNTRLDDAAVARLAECVNLRYLRLDQTLVTDEGLQHLGQLPALFDLHLRDTSITDAGLTEVRPHRLGGLDVSGTKVRGEWLLNSPVDSQLRSLNLARTQIGDEQVRALRGLPMLTELDLSGTPITDACLPVLVQLPLKELAICETKLSASAILASGLRCVVHVRDGQFEPDDLAALEKTLATVHVRPKGDD